jgi:hypothetical protein
LRPPQHKNGNNCLQLLQWQQLDKGVQPLAPQPSFIALVVDWAKALAGPNQAHNDMAALAAHIKQPLPLHHNGLSGFTAKTCAKLLEVDVGRDLW